MSDSIDILREHLAEFRSEVMEKLGELACEHRQHGETLRKLADGQDHCTVWQSKHEEHHGLHADRRPWIWVANSTAWAWHHPGRTLALMAVGIAVVAPPVRSWLAGNLPHLARWALGGI